MNSITLVMAYFNNLGQLKRQYDLLYTMPDSVKANVHVIVVDDCSDEAPATKAKLGMPSTLFRITEKKPWNQDAARNIGAFHAVTKWLLLTDIDHMVPRETWATLINTEFREDQIYTFARVSAPKYDPYKPHPNSWFMTKEMYQRTGGYDERFAGWYGTDADFRDRCRQHARIVPLPEVLVRVGREVVPDASTPRDKFGGHPKDKVNGENIRRIKQERNAIPGWRPITLSFPYERV